jgi:ribonuclease HII
VQQAGVDEAGRGCLAGPVVAAAVVLPPGYVLPGLTDSKKLSALQRARLRQQLEADLPAGSWAIGEASPAEIDERNILQATYLAMHRAIAQLSPAPTELLIDGNRFAPYPALPHRCEVKGDARFACISAASIFAKTHRDTLMDAAHTKFPAYGWNVNKGYPTEAHRLALEEHGESPLHRSTFKRKPVSFRLFAAATWLVASSVFFASCSPDSAPALLDRALPSNSTVVVPWSSDEHAQRDRSSAWRGWRNQSPLEALGAGLLDSAASGAEGRLVWHRTGASGMGWLWLGQRQDFPGWRNKSDWWGAESSTSRPYAQGTVWSLKTPQGLLFLGEKEDLLALSSHEQLVDEALRQMDVEVPVPTVLPAWQPAPWMPSPSALVASPSSAPSERFWPLAQWDTLPSPWSGWSAECVGTRPADGQSSRMAHGPGEVPWQTWTHPNWRSVDLRAADGKDSLDNLPPRSDGYWWGRVQGVVRGLPVQGWMISTPDSTTAWNLQEEARKWVKAPPGILFRATAQVGVWASSEAELQVLVEFIRTQTTYPLPPEAPRTCHAFGMRTTPDAAFSTWLQWETQSGEKSQFTLWATTPPSFTEAPPSPQE